MTDGPFILGLTGSIGTGKTTTAAMFADLGADVWSADDAVSRIYSAGAAGEAAVRRICPEAVSCPGGGVDRGILKTILAKTPGLLKELEDAVHPLVKADRAEFLGKSRADLAVAEIPLLFETGSGAEFDAVATVVAPPEVQRRRVLERGTMTESEFETLLRRQMPTSKKVAAADYVIEAVDMKSAKRKVCEIVKDIRRGDGNRSRCRHRDNRIEGQRRP